jgi:hypothetical protein
MIRESNPSRLPSTPVRLSGPVQWPDFGGRFDAAPLSWFEISYTPYEGRTGDGGS